MKKHIFLSLSTLLLSGCIFTPPSTSSSNSISSSSTSSSSTSTIIQSTNEYGETLLNGYYKATTQTLDLHNMRKSYVFNDLPSVGDVNILVVPVRFKDSTYVEPDVHPAMIMCTSGTIGVPKGAILSETNVMTNVSDIAEYFKFA